MLYVVRDPENKDKTINKSPLVWYLTKDDLRIIWNNYEDELPWRNLSKAQQVEAEHQIVNAFARIAINDVPHDSEDMVHQTIDQLSKRFKIRKGRDWKNE